MVKILKRDGDIRSIETAYHSPVDLVEDTVHGACDTNSISIRVLIYALPACGESVARGAKPGKNTPLNWKWNEMTVRIKKTDAKTAFMNNPG